MSSGTEDEYIPHEFRPVVYIAGPFRYPEPFANIRAAIETGEHLESTGLITAWVPHQNALWAMIYPHDADFWLDYDIAQLAKSNALLRIPGASDGADDEIEFAHEVHMPVFYEEDKVIAWARDWLGQ